MEDVKYCLEDVQEMFNELAESDPTLEELVLEYNNLLAVAALIKRELTDEEVTMPFIALESKVLH